ncbi:MAG: hypothetical protein B6I28_03425 [Fusobacteriia bacterium 4572_132]|nr:MAG: hypothetical protein B6I28_03425 [Fusobacteriia bacterium 4572_132]
MDGNLRKTLKKVMKEKDINSLNKIMDKIAKKANLHSKFLENISENQSIQYFILINTEKNSELLIKILNKFEGMKWYKKIYKNLHHRDLEVRRYFLSEIGKAKTDIFIEILIEMLRDSVYQLRVDVAKILLKYKTKHSMRLLVSMLDDSDRRVVKEITYILVEFQEEILPFLDRYLKLPMKRIKLNILDVLNRIYSMKTLRYLVLLSTDRSEQVKIKAQHILILLLEKLNTDVNFNDDQLMLDFLKEEIQKLDIKNISNLIKILLKFKEKGAKLILEDIENRWSEKAEYFILFNKVESEDLIYLTFEMLNSKIIEIKEKGLDILSKISVKEEKIFEVIEKITEYVIESVENMSKEEKETIINFMKRHNILKKYASKLKSENEIEREIAVTVMGLLDEPKLHMLLLTRLKDPSIKIRKSIVKILGEERNEKYIEAFEKMLVDPNEDVQISAMEAIAKLGTPKAKKVIFEALEHPNEEIQKLANKIIEKESLKNYINKFDELSEVEKNKIAKILTRLGKESMDILEEQIKSTDVEVRKRIIRILNYVEDKNRYRNIFKEALKDPEKEIRSSVIKLIVDFADREILVLLLKLLNDPDKRVRANAVEAFGDIKNKTATKILKPFLKDKNNRIRGNAIMALYRLGDESGFNEINEMIRDKSELMRSTAVYIIGTLKLENKKHILDELQNDHSILVKNNIIRALYNFKEVDKIAYYLKDPQNEVRLSAKEYYKKGRGLL